MGVDAYQTNQTSQTTFCAVQSTTPINMLLPQMAAAPSAKCCRSATKCRPLDHVPLLGWVPPPVRCRPEQGLDQGHQGKGWTRVSSVVQ